MYAVVYTVIYIYSHIYSYTVSYPGIFSYHLIRIGAQIFLEQGVVKEL